MRHHIQKSILYNLAFSEGLRFSELQPDDIENKLFDYHLKQLVAEKLVQKNKDGLYELTATGRKLGVSILDSMSEKINRARSVLFLIVRRKGDGAWLLYRRRTHPLINLKGFMHTIPTFDASVFDTATTEVKKQTGVEATFSYSGSGYLRTYKGNELESFTHFTLLLCEEASGGLVQNNIRAEFFWELEPNFSSDDMLPNMKMLVDNYLSGTPFFIEASFKV